ncbi:MAG: metalloprotease [Methanobacteriota archaeon]|nr:MAG: metalloprotease [Euryarchaeota archaeon]
MGRIVLCALAFVIVLSAMAIGTVDRAAASDLRAASEIAREYVKGHVQQLGLAASDITEVVLSSEVVSRDTGITHVYLEQRYRGIEVYAGILTLSLRPDGGVLSARSRFVSNLAAATDGQAPKISAIEAATAVAESLDLNPTSDFRLVSQTNGADMASTISDGGIALAPIDAVLVWLPLETSVRLAWSVEIQERGGDHWWTAFVDAETGASLGQDDSISHDSAEAIALAIDHRGGASTTVPMFPITDGATYRVFPLPMESPSDGGRALVSGAADPSASPFGWHDTNGVPGPEFTVTRGNNVHAYADRDANNVPDAGSSPDGGAALAFDFSLDLTKRPFDSQAAAATNLFYWNNVMHDVAYNYGFDEAAGNFQVNNYGHGGLGNDDVRAEAQDGSGRNNANFGTPVDGLRPRMQMFEWRSSAPNPVTVLPPSPIAGTYYGPMAGFGESLTTTGPITRGVAYVGRGCSPAYQQGQPFDPFLADPSGKIALMDRGSCTFVAKIKRAQDAGAALVIMVNNIPGAPIAMGGADPTITIPSVMISLGDGSRFKANLPLTATVADGTGGAPDRDSDVDAGVIAHEYTHGISNRLTGGPATVSCLGNAEQMGEGWSDWFALTVTTSPSDTRMTPRGVGTYVIYEPPNGVGIRPTAYATDMTVNPSTYASVADVVGISQPHGIGYVWATMLWEVYWNLVDRYGYNANVYDDWSTGGNNLALQLVMDGLKFQPCRPGFVDGRNAILDADLALTGGANLCEIWRGFAKRGLGFSASQGSSLSRTDGVQAFDLPSTCTAATFGGFRPPVSGPPAINRRNAGSTVPLKFTLSGAWYLVTDSQRIDCDTLLPVGERPSPLTLPGSTKISRQGAEYHINWKTDGAWAGTCRRLTLRIPAPADAVAYFRFD